MAVVATNIKKGQCIKFNGEMGVVLGLDHRTPGKGNAIIMAHVRSIQNGKTKSVRFASSDKVEIVPVDRTKLEFSYSDPSGYYFMDTETYDTSTLSEELLGDAKDYLIENLAVEVLFIEGNPVSIDMPSSVELEVTESSDGIKGDTANNPQKPATLETGKEIQVPLFIKPGDRVKVDTETGKYLGRV